MIFEYIEKNLKLKIKLKNIHNKKIKENVWNLQNTPFKLYHLIFFE